MLHKEAKEIKEAIESLPPFYRKELFRAFRKLDKSLSQTIGKDGADWLDKVTGNELPHDLHAVLVGNLEPDESGILRSK